MTDDKSIFEAIETLRTNARGLIAEDDKADALHILECTRAVMFEVASALESVALRPTPAPAEPGAMVLPLEWQLFDDVFGGGWQATTLGGLVTIRRSVSAVEPFEIAGVRFTSIEAAQASAQTVHDQRMREIIKAFPTPSGIEEATRVADLLAAFGKDICLSLNWGAVDDDEGSAHQWRVHRVRGNRSDREWTLIGTGPTPIEAIRKALKERT